MGMQAFLGYALRTTEERYRKVSFSDFETTADARNLNMELKRDSSSRRISRALTTLFHECLGTPPTIRLLAYSFRTNQDGHFISSIISPDIVILAGDY